MKYQALILTRLAARLREQNQRRLAAVQREARVLKALMQRAALLLALALPVTCQAGQANLAWNPSPTPGVTNYVLNASPGAAFLLPALVRVNTKTNLSASVDFATNGVWSFWVTAQKDGIESDPSNVLTIEVPRPATNLRTLVLEASIDLSGTNWTDAGFFRLRLK